MRQDEITESEIKLTNLEDLGDSSYVSLSTDSCIKSLEEDYLYQIAHDNLYEINQDALDFLTKCNGSATISDLDPDREFLEFCIVEDLLDVSKEKIQRPINLGKSPIPSLRYLEWMVTRRCNLSCAHCYLGDSKKEDYNPELIRPLLDEFTRMQGLRILVSGGEPTLYKHFKFLNKALLIILSVCPLDQRNDHE